MLFISTEVRDLPCLTCATQDLSTGSSRGMSCLHTSRARRKSQESAHVCNFPGLGFLQRIQWPQRRVPELRLWWGPWAADYPIKLLAGIKSVLS